MQVPEIRILANTLSMMRNNNDVIEHLHTYILEYDSLSGSRFEEGPLFGRAFPCSLFASLLPSEG